MNDRIDALEEALAHQGRALDEMSDELRRQGDTIERLRRELLDMREGLGRVEDAMGGPAPAEKPPHY